MCKELNRFQKLSDKLRVISATELLSNNHLNLPGWRSQQILKILAADLFESGCYCVLDAKNIMIKKTAKKDLFSKIGLPLSNQIDYTGHGEFRVYYENGLKIFGVEINPNIVKDALPTVTPVILYKHICDEMRAEIVKLHDKTFDYFIADDTELRSTEFLLYGAYLKSQAKIESYYNFSKEMSSVTFFSVSPKTREQFNAIMNTLLNDTSIRFMGIHSKRYSKLTMDDKNDIAQFWEKLGLFESKEEGIGYFDSI